MDALVMKLLIMGIVALIVTLGLIFAEWRTNQLSLRATGLKGVVAVIVAGVIISLLTVR
ncbi:hypothetical protein [Lacticaseibacillus camelliae]|uniref:Uncharacterized protein n=1 Tax=Lacticaseibacillus camelliae DSM 22697 = JCM 13995 TaxID=1423730 RepID=A0A0R2FGS9_9LACO|nr:hypothetical protein [Lacticaseibacillus camelliae]KRN25253.1 hypothetical protein FC75_GL000808 [Lacticaseibacillus camelliae DSM 22697 = JCM 13995]